MSNLASIQIKTIHVEDIRFALPEVDFGSDAVNTETVYSSPYIVVETNQPGVSGKGGGSTLGRGNEMVCHAIAELAPIVEGQSLAEIVGDFARYWRLLANPLQSRWLGPASGPYYMAAGAITNAIFDLWAKVEKKPLWKLLAELPTEHILSMLDFRYVEHLLTREEAHAILERNAADRNSRIAELERAGIPAYYTTWLGSEIESIIGRIAELRDTTGVNTFKVKVGRDLEEDKTRLGLIRETFGNDITLLADANQVWSVPRAIEWMRALESFGLGWIEEPTAPDMVDGHRLIREQLSPLGIEVVTGEQCPNVQLAAQFIASGAVDRYQIDACRVVGPPENILIMLVAAKYDVPVCPHAGGAGLDEMSPHLLAWNYVLGRPTFEKVLCEQVGFCSRFFEQPSVVRDGRVQLGEAPGYLVGMKEDARETYRLTTLR
ncbi:MAG: enolase C-terminal domain-like protein [Spirochaetota bacterium]